MNDVNGRIVADSCTAIPPADNTWRGADRNTLISAILMLEEKNKNLQAENAELREKCMTRFARIKNAANADDMAQMLHKLYMTGYGDALYYKETGKNDPTYNNVSDLSQWLQEIGKI